MKGMKKLLSILMVLTLVLSLGVSALADGGARTVTVTIQGATGLDTEHTYKAYQIFTGTMANPEEDGPLGEIKWGSGVDSTTFLAALQADSAFSTIFADCTTAKEVASKMESFTDAQTKAFGKLALDHLAVPESCVTFTGDASGNATAELVTGYYVIKDTTPDLSEGEVKNDIVVEVVGDMVIAAKNEAPSSEKKVKEKDDTKDATTGWQDAADYDIGDEIEYRLEAKIPVKALKAYEKYMLNFVDEISKGLTYKSDSYEIYVGEKDSGGTKLEAGNGLDSFTFNGSGTSSVYSDGKKLTWNCTDIKAIQAVKDAMASAGDNGFVYIYIYYTATLNNDAIIAGAGNPNKFQIEYNRNPNGDEKGTTPLDTNVVFTFDTIVNKVDEDNEALKGAGFTLYKQVPSGSVSLDGHTGSYQKIGDELKGTDMTTFEFSGLDSGSYVLVETTVPAGYNKADDIEFTVEATYTGTESDPTATPTLSNLVVKNAANEEISGAGKTFTVTTTPTDNKGSITTTVKNEQGPVLPETGGIGTTIFYVAGAILVAGAAILLVTKKRVNGAEK